jgi:hypothetical protein
MRSLAVGCDKACICQDYPFIHRRKRLESLLARGNIFFTCSHSYALGFPRFYRIESPRISMP